METITGCPASICARSSSRARSSSERLRSSKGIATFSWKSTSRFTVRPWNIRDGLPEILQVEEAESAGEPEHHSLGERDPLEVENVSNRRRSAVLTRPVTKAFDHLRHHESLAEHRPSQDSATPWARAAS